MLLQILLVTTPLLSRDVSPEEATRRTAALRIAALQGLGAEAPIDVKPVAVKDALTQPEKYKIDYEDAFFLVDKRSGFISLSTLRSASSQAKKLEPWDDSKQISSSQVSRLIERYASLAGVAGESYKLRYCERSLLNGAKALHCVFHAVHQAIPFAPEHASTADLEYDTGALLLMYAEPLPTPAGPPNVRSSATQARAQALSFILSETDVEVAEETEAPSLCWWRPESRTTGRGNKLEPRHKQLATENKAMLVYRSIAVDANSYSEELEKHWRVFESFVDAESGRLLNVHEWRPFGGSGAVTMQPSKKLVLPASFTLVGNNKCLTVKSSDLKETSSRPGGGKPLFLLIGNRAERASFDGKLLSIGKGDDQRAYKPSPKLLESLRALVGPSELSTGLRPFLHTHISNSQSSGTVW